MCKGTRVAVHGSLTPDIWSSEGRPGLDVTLKGDSFPSLATPDNGKMVEPETKSNAPLRGFLRWEVLGFGGEL